MSSVTASTSQIPRSGTHLYNIAAGTFYADIGTNTLLDGFTVGTGNCQAKIGSSVIFTTPSAVTTALGGAALAGNAMALASSAADLYRDMGKEIKIFTQGTGSGPAELYCILTRVRLVAGDSNNLTEGENGRLGYVSTWAAVPGTASIKVTVARVGAGHSRS